MDIALPPPAQRGLSVITKATLMDGLDTIAGMAKTLADREIAQHLTATDLHSIGDMQKQVCEQLALLIMQL